MIIDKLENIGRYAALHPLFPAAFDFLLNTDLANAEPGKRIIDGENLWANIDVAVPKSQNDALLETHDRYIDIQLPLTHSEQMGYAPRADLAEARYDADKDIAFYPEKPGNYLQVDPGMFVIFFPEDAHAPAITPTTLKKVIVKVKA